VDSGSGLQSIPAAQDKESTDLKPLEASLRDGSRGGVMVWELDLDLRFEIYLEIGDWKFQEWTRWWS
jgi:hypothetical protein